MAAIQLAAEIQEARAEGNFEATEVLLALEAYSAAQNAGQSASVLANAWRRLANALAACHVGADLGEQPSPAPAPALSAWPSGAIRLEDGGHAAQTAVLDAAYDQAVRLHAARLNREHFRGVQLANPPADPQQWAHVGVEDHLHQHTDGTVHAHPHQHLLGKASHGAVGDGHPPMTTPALAAQQLLPNEIAPQQRQGATTNVGGGRLVPAPPNMPTDHGLGPISYFQPGDKCANCGATQSGGGRFCPNCGVPAGEDATTTAAKAHGRELSRQRR